MSVQGDNFRNLAEAFDTSSEAVRRMAETAKAAALGGLIPKEVIIDSFDRFFAFAG